MAGSPPTPVVVDLTNSCVDTLQEDDDDGAPLDVSWPPPALCLKNDNALDDDEYDKVHHNNDVVVCDLTSLPDSQPLQVQEPLDVGFFSTRSPARQQKKKQKLAPSALDDTPEARLARAAYAAAMPPDADNPADVAKATQRAAGASSRGQQQHILDGLSWTWAHRASTTAAANATSNEYVGKWTTCSWPSSLWPAIASATEQGSLGRVSKAMLKDDDPAANPEGKMMLCVYAEDYRDAKDIARIGFALCRVAIQSGHGDVLHTANGARRTLHFKPDCFTIEGRYALPTPHTKSIGQTAIYHFQPHFEDVPTTVFKRGERCCRCVVVEPGPAQAIDGAAEPLDAIHTTSFWTRAANNGAPWFGDASHPLAVKAKLLIDANGNVTHTPPSELL